MRRALLGGVFAALRTAPACSLAASLALVRPALAEEAQLQHAADGGPSKAECAQAFEESQRLRNAARYLEANVEVLKCTSPKCGAALSEECSKIYAELATATPSVVFAARDAAGAEVDTATIIVDDNPTTYAIDGKPVSLDPGTHRFTFQADRFVGTTQTAVVRTGERFRPITVVLQPVSRSESSAAIDAGRPAPAKPSPVPTPVYVLGGVAVVGFGAFAAFRAWGAHDFDDLSRTCKPDCSSSSVDAVRQKYLLSGISLAVGGAAAVAGVTWYLVGRDTPTESASRVQIAPTRDGVAARFSTTF